MGVMRDFCQRIFGRIFKTIPDTRLQWVEEISGRKDSKITQFHDPFLVSPGIFLTPHLGSFTEIFRGFLSIKLLNRPLEISLSHEHILYHPLLHLQVYS